MHLNKHGWGLKEMLILSGILIIFLIIATYYIYCLYNGLGINTNLYAKMEEKLENQAGIFLNDYYDLELSDDYITISRAVLKEYDLDVSLIDNDGNACSGYVVANNKEINSYIKCENYMTEGYEEWRN